MPTYAEDAGYASLKIINIYPENMMKGIPTSFAQVILIDAKSGDIIAMLDGTYVTQLRTGAAFWRMLRCIGSERCENRSLNRNWRSGSNPAGSDACG